MKRKPAPKLKCSGHIYSLSSAAAEKATTTTTTPTNKLETYDKPEKLLIRNILVTAGKTTDKSFFKATKITVPGPGLVDQLAIG